MEMCVRFEFGMSGSLKTGARELAKYELDLMGIQEVRQDRGGAEPAWDYSFFCAD